MSNNFNFTQSLEPVNYEYGNSADAYEGLTSANIDRLQMIQYLDNYIANGGIVNPRFDNLEDAGAYGASEAAKLYQEGIDEKTFGDLSQQSFDMVQDINSQPYTYNALEAMNGFMGNTNPHEHQQASNPFDFNQNPNTQSSFNHGTSNPFDFNQNPNTHNNLSINTQNPNRFVQQSSNPFLEGFQNFGTEQNSAFNHTVDNALNNVQDRVNSQFGLSGRGGSGMHSKIMSESLGDTANQMYSDNFNANQNRNLQAMDSGSTIYNSDFNNNLSGTGFNANQWQGDFDNTLGLNRENNTVNQTNFNNAISTTGLNADQWQQQFNNANTIGELNNNANQTNFSNNTDLTARNADLWQQGFNNNFETTNANASIYNNDRSAQMNAAGQLPALQNSQFTGANIANTFGTQQDDLNHYNDNLDWNNLQNYSSIIAGLQGTQLPQQEESSTLDKLLGVASVAGGFL